LVFIQALVRIMRKSERRLLRVAVAFAVITGGVVAMENPARGQDRERITVLEENDGLFFNSDKHYTQGLRISDLHSVTAPGFWNSAFDLFGSVAPIFAPGGNRQESLFLGQSIFTPKNTQIRPPDPRDRPYAGWLYFGASLLQETNGRMLENFELELGTVGPGALAEQVQNDFHQFIGTATAKGWSSQLQSEFGAVLSYERKWRLPIAGTSGFGVDVVPQLGASVGNIFTYGDIGTLLRIGSGLGADYGPARIRPALSGTDYFDERGLDDGRSFYFFAGAQGRAVARNIFLDGNSYRASRSVPKENFVGDLQAGFSASWSKSFRLDVSVVLRSKEFRGQRSADDICTAALAFTW
jgi:lipid A 3-O-deacylase